MDYIVLAAGRGTRLGNLGSYIQKSMYPILEKPFLEYILTSIVTNKYYSPTSDSIIIVVGHLKATIINYFGATFSGNNLKYAIQTNSRGTADALLVGKQAGCQTCPSIVLQGDTYVRNNEIERLIENPYSTALSLAAHYCENTHNERVDASADLVINAWKGTGPFIDAGLWKVDSTLRFELSNSREGEARFLPALQELISYGLKVGYVVRDSWIHLGGTEPSTQSNLAEIYRYFLDQEVERDNF